MVRIILEDTATIDVSTPELPVSRTYTGPVSLTFESVSVMPPVDGASDYTHGVIYVPKTGVSFLSEQRVPEYYQALLLLVPFVFVLAFRSIMR